MQPVLARRVDVGRRVEAGTPHRVADGVLVGGRRLEQHGSRVDTAERDAHRAVDARRCARDARSVDAERDRGEGVAASRRGA